MTSGLKDIKTRKSEFAARNQILYLHPLINSHVGSIL